MNSKIITIIKKKIPKEQEQTYSVNTLETSKTSKTKTNGMGQYY